MKTVLFDLDGTLLPMDQDAFVKVYFGYLAKDMAPLGYESEKLIQNVWGGTKAMVQNDGSKTNEEAFWNYFAKCYGEDHLKDKEYFNDFYRDHFFYAKSATSVDPDAIKVIEYLKDKGIQIVLATNPIFPRIATLQRVEWAGLNKDDFALITTYENSTYCKPNPKYYEEIINKLNLNPSECIMVGNDAIEDTAALKTGMQVFMITRCLLNGDKKDISSLPQGTFKDFIDWIKEYVK
jgi:HAD superfamily hydrolase (TIGR01509 family)